MAVADYTDDSSDPTALLAALRGRSPADLTGHLDQTREVYRQLTTAAQTQLNTRALISLERGYQLVASAAREKGAMGGLFEC